MKHLLPLLVLSLSAPVSAAAEEISYEINGTVDVSVWDKSDRAALGLDQDDIYNISFSMVVDENARNFSTSPDQGVFKGEAIGFRFGPMGYSERRRTLSSITSTFAANKILRVHDQSNDSIHLNFNPVFNRSLPHIDTVNVSAIMNSAILSEPTIAETLVQQDDLQLALITSFVLINTQNGNQIFAVVDSPTISVSVRP